MVGKERATSRAQTPEPPDETALIRAALSGTPQRRIESFNRLVEWYQDAVYTLAYRILGEPARAADATQEAFITAYRRLETYRGGSFRAWLMRITANQCYDILRRERRRAEIAFDDLAGADSDDGASLPDNAESPEDAAQRAELHRAIQDCINALSTDQRMVLVLSDIEGLDYAAIAETVSAQLGTVKSRLSRARASVRDCLQAVRELLPPEFRLISDET